MEQAAAPSHTRNGGSGVDGVAGKGSRGWVRVSGDGVRRGEKGALQGAV